ncbi:MAG: hypothetical protein AB1813_27080, partial [Verrucomicrobiota bacterium]
LVYSDEAGQNSLAGQVGLELYPLNAGNPAAAAGFERRQDSRALRNKTKSFGLIEIRASQLRPNTTYFYKIKMVDARGQESFWPASGALPSVTTATENSFVLDSRQLILSIPGNDVAGRIVTLSAEGAAHPLSAVVGDGASPNEVFFNLSDLFALVGGKNFVPIGPQEFAIEVQGPPISGGSARYSLNFTTEFHVGGVERQSIGREFLSLTVGSGFVENNQEGSVSIHVENNPGVAQLSFVLDLPPDRLSNFSVEAVAPELNAPAVTSISSREYRVDLNIRAGQTLSGNREVARLKFAAQNQPSAFVPLKVMSIDARKADNIVVGNLFGESGRVVIIGAQPLLEARFTEDKRRFLTLYGRPLAGYQVQVSSDLSGNGHWRNFVRIPMTDYAHDIFGLSDNPHDFYRAFEFGDQPVIDLVRNANGSGKLTVFGKAGANYRIETTRSLTPPVRWDPMLDFTLSGSYKFIDDVNLNEAILFYRIVKP